jgi:hypothetical protein
VKRIFFFITLCCWPLLGNGQQTQQDVESFMNELLYGGLKKIDSVGFIHVHLKNSESNKLGLTSEDLTDFLKLRYKNNFGNIPFLDKSKKIGEIKNREAIGNLWCGVWTVGDDYPIAYHVECRFGSFGNPSIVSDEVLGYGNKRNVPESIKNSIDRMTSEFAIQFYKSRGEM